MLGIGLGVTDIEKSLQIFEGPLGMQKQPVGTSADPVWQAPRILLDDENPSPQTNNDAIQNAKNMALLNYGDPLNARKFLWRFCEHWCSCLPPPLRSVSMLQSYFCTNTLSLKCLN
jgi:hypothetical protein